MHHTVSTTKFPLMGGLVLSIRKFHCGLLQRHDRTFRVSEMCFRASGARSVQTVVLQVNSVRLPCIPSRHVMRMLTVLLALLLCCPLPAWAKERPNVIYIMADELGYYELSCLGNPNIQTPRIDQMMSEGIRFTQALAGSSVCAPTRCCLMTGKHSGHTSVRSNGGGTPLRADEMTIASILREAGYATGGFGKWGCGGRGSTGVPEQHGFDVFLGYYDQVHAHSYYPPYLVRNSREVPLPNNRGGSDGETYSHYVIVDEAMQFIRDNQNQPFFCYMPITPPHGIFDIPDEDPAWAIYRDKDWPEQAKRYAAMVTMVDRQVGEIMDLLDELSLKEDTIVFFCGDNGGNDYFRDKEHPRGFHGANVNPVTGVEFRGTKGTLYEGGLRIPMTVRWPGKIHPGQVSDLLWYFPDVLPTLAELTGARLPEGIDGMSIVPELLGEEAAGRKQRSHEYLYWEIGGQTAVRKAHWKAIQAGSNRDWELYDLSRDVSESQNVAGQHSDVLAELKRLASEAHEPVEEGTFSDREMHERDRRAKFGNRPVRGTKKVNSMARSGLLPIGTVKIASVSSESVENQKLAVKALDGDPRTHWHTRFTPEIDKHPHELVLDLGRQCTVTGVRYLARQDGGWNGALADCEFQLSRSLDEFKVTVGKTRFRKSKLSQEIRWPASTGRFLRVRILSEVNGGPWASIAELGVIGE